MRRLLDNMKRKTWDFIMPKSGSEQGRRQQCGYLTKLSTAQIC